MKRYQLYLNPQSVGLIDLFQNETDISRSKIIRLTVDALAENFAKLLVDKKKIAIQGPLDQIVGIIKPRGRKTTNLAEKVDEIYLSN